MPPSPSTKATKADAASVIAAARWRLQHIDFRAVDPELRRVITLAIRLASEEPSADSSDGTVHQNVEDFAAVIGRIRRTIPAGDRARLAGEWRALDDDPTYAAGEVTRALVALCDILRARLVPWDKVVVRRFGIVCDADGYPVHAPQLLHGEVLGTLVDEREHAAIPTASYTLTDHDGEEHDVLGPAADAGVGQVSITRLRAWLRTGFSTMRKAMELLLPSHERKLGAAYGPEWPFPCGIPGLSKPGTRGVKKSVDIRVYLAAHRFGFEPTRAADDEEEAFTVAQGSPAPVLPRAPLPPAHASISSSPSVTSQFFSSKGYVVRATDRRQSFTVFKAGVQQSTLVRHPENPHVLFSRTVEGSIVPIEGVSFFTDERDRVEPLPGGRGERR